MKTEQFTINTKLLYFIVLVINIIFMQYCVLVLILVLFLF